MKKTFLAILGIAIFSGAMAQKSNDNKFRFNVGPEIDFASGGFNDTHSVGIGATIQGEIKGAPSTNYTLTTGFVSYAGRKISSGVKATAQTIVPIKVGVKYFLSQGFYAAGQVGVGVLATYASGVALAYTPMLGYEFNTKSGKAVDAGFKYDGYSKNGGSISSIGFRLAYRF